MTTTAYSTYENAQEVPRREFRTKTETIELFRIYAHEFETQAARTNDREEAMYAAGKAAAYNMAAFEIEQNMR